MVQKKPHIYKQSVEPLTTGNGFKGGDIKSSGQYLLETVYGNTGTTSA